MTWGERLTTVIDDVVSLQFTCTTESTREGPGTSKAKGRGMQNISTHAQVGGRVPHFRCG